MTPKVGRQLPRRPGADNMSYTSRGMTGNDDSDDSDYKVNHYPVQSQPASGGRVVGDSDDEEDSGAAGNADYEAAVTNGDDNESSASFSAFRTNRGNQRAQRESREAEAEAAAAAQLQAQQNEALRELEEHRKRLQLYVLVCRCIAYPFIAKQPTDMARRQPKITKQQLQQVKAGHRPNRNRAFI